MPRLLQPTEATLEERYLTLFSQMLDGCALHEMIFDAEGRPVDYRFLAVNPAFERITGLSANTIAGKTVLEVLPDTEKHWIEAYGRVVQTGEPYQFESHHAGLKKHFEVVAFRPQAGQFACIFRDVTQHKEQEWEIKRLTHLHAVLSQINQAVVRAVSREELFQSICRIGIEFGHFRLTWIGLLDPETGNLRLAAEDRGEQDFLFPISASECTISREAVESGQPVIRNAATEAQSGSCAAFPIRGQGKVCGALCLHAAEEAFFDSAEIKLLEEAAMDISFALDKFEEEANRRISEKRHRDLFEHMLEGLAYCEMIYEDGEPRDFRYLAVNAAFETLTGLKDVTGKLVSEVLPNIQKSDPELFAIYGRVAQTGTPETFEMFLEALGIWFSVSVYSPEKSHFVAVFDITTERKRAEHALRESERRLSLAMEATSDGLFEWDMHTGEAYFSPRYYTMLGYAPGEFKPGRENFLELLHPADREPLLAILQEYATHTRDSHQAEFRLRTKTGDWRWILSRGRAVARDADGHAPKMVGTHVDITERKRAEFELRESEARFSDVFFRAPAIMSISTIEDGRFLDVNDTFLAATGYTREEMIGRTSVELGLLTEEERARQLGAFLKNGRLSGVELRLLGKNGKPVECVFEYVSISVGGTPRLLSIGLDISEWKRHEAEKRSLEDQLRQAQKLESIGRLAGGIAHDFNNLLTVINGYSAMTLAQMHAEDPARDGVEEIHKAGDRATALVRQLLAFSRRQVLQPEVISLNTVVVEMEKMLPRLLGEDVEVATRLGPAPNFLMADRQQLEQVIMNLVVNARDAMPNGGRLAIETETVLEDPGADRLGPHVRLTVRDTGMGIDEETRLHLFEPFFTTKPAGKGTGLGLATVHGIVTQSGGYIEVESEPGTGTTFHIYFPAAEPRPGPAGLKKATPTAGGNETILLVEDRKDVRQFVASVLARRGYRVIDVEGGEAALAEVANRTIDLLVTDVVMPRMSGVELTSRARLLRPDLKTLFISGHPSEMSEQHSNALTNAPYLQKPFTPEGLAAKVREVLGTPGTRARILVVDDEYAVRRILRLVLERAGYEVGEAENGDQALHALEDTGADAVITDLVMPEREGVETIQSIRRDYPEVRIIAISGASGGAYLRLACRLGADAALTKPVVPELLLAEVARVLGAAKSRS